jgi:hypothetical protein
MDEAVGAILARALVAPDGARSLPFDVPAHMVNGIFHGSF